MAARTVQEQLAAAGLLAPDGDMSDAPTGAELQALEAEVEAWEDEHPEGLGLAKALDENRSAR